MADQTPGTEFVIAEVLQELRELCHLRDTERGSKRHRRAVQDFTTKHVGLAYSLAARYRRRGINDQELRHTALLGLLEAINRWNPEKAACFSTFADFRMRHEIQQYLRRQLPLVRCSELVHKDQLQIGKLKREARHKLRPEPTQDELVKKTGLSPARVKAALETNTRDLGYEQLPGVLLDKQAPDARQYCFNRNAKQLVPQPRAIEDAMIECIDARRAKPVEQVFAQTKPEPRKRLVRPGLASLALFASVEYVVWGTKGRAAKLAHDGPFPGSLTIPILPSEKQHQTAKPLALMEQLVRPVIPGGIILDPFAGSGTTGVAALRTGRSFVGIEQEQAYYDIACRRLAATQDEKSTGKRAQRRRARGW